MTIRTRSALIATVAAVVIAGAVTGGVQVANAGDDRPHAPYRQQSADPTLRQLPDGTWFYADDLS